MTKYKFHHLRTTNPKEYSHLRWQQYKEEIDRNKHWKEEAIKEILEKLMNSHSRSESFGKYSKEDIEKAIMQVRGVDPRTIKNWFTILWKLEFVLQPKPQLFQLNFGKIASLEIKIPPQIDPLQTRLGGKSL